MSKETHLLDSHYNEYESFKEDALRAYREAALSDSHMFGEYDGYQAYKGDE